MHPCLAAGEPDWPRVLHYAARRGCCDLGFFVGTEMRILRELYGPLYGSYFLVTLLLLAIFTFPPGRFLSAPEMGNAGTRIPRAG